MSDPPLLQARRTAQVALTVTNSRRWPNAFMLGMSDAGEGSSMWYTLSHSYGANSRMWSAFSATAMRKKAPPVQRWYTDMFGQALRAADGQQSIDALARTFNDQPPQEPRAFVESVLGSAMAERYDRALQGKGEPADSARDMVLGAFILRSVIPQLAMIAQ